MSVDRIQGIIFDLTQSMQDLASELSLLAEKQELLDRRMRDQPESQKN